MSFTDDPEFKALLEAAADNGFKEENHDYTVDIKLTLRVRDVEDEFEAQNYMEQFISSGLNDLCYSDDDDDDHYRLESAHADWRTFKEVPCSD